MIWYLLYPLRGTTEAPVLFPTHPLRRAFTRYGRYAARHVLATLLISVAFALIAVYPCPFFYSNDFTSAASNVPHHVWTDAQPLDERSVSEPDVIMRHVWVHGSYMRALERDVLLGALEIQDELLGPTVNFDPRQPPGSRLPVVDVDDMDMELSPEDRDRFHVVNGLTNQSWFFHSPLQYWSCLRDNILQDQDIIATVNERKSQCTSVNVTLRHSIVFSGKRFEDRRLVAADALVITLIHLRDSPVGRYWERKAEALAVRMADKYTVIPADGRISSSQLYEFQFRPVSAQDSALLVVAYSLMTVYFLLSLSKLRALKSRAGLIVTILTQILVSMASSLTVCALLKVDLSKIPYAAYPLVILTISMENSFRLVNAVIMTSPNHSTSNRIGEAFGATAHVAVASRIQNLLLLWALSKITFPGVSAFCTFAAIAILFDFFYLSTFFLSVLSIDVQRTELSDALDKAVATSNMKSKSGRGIQGRQTWSDAVLQGKIALSTRIAGTIVMVGFVLMAQWHFLESDGVWTMLSRVLNLPKNPWEPASTPKSSLLIPIHQARSPTSWLRLQDHETAREVINVVKPWAHSYVARVYDPLVFVVKGADREPPRTERLFLPAVYDFLRHELPRFVVIVLVCMGLVWLFMNYLLWDELAEAKQDDPEDQPLLSIKSLPGGHELDVAMLTSTSTGHLISAGLDRTIQVWDVRTGSRARIISNPERPEEDPFPILGMTTSRDSNWLAILSPKRVLLWNLWERRWEKSVEVDMVGHKSESFFFSEERHGPAIPSVVIVKRNGTMLEVQLERDLVKEYLVCKTPLICVVPTEERSFGSPMTPRQTILTASRKSCIHRVIKNDDAWLSQELKFPTREERDIHSLLPVKACGIYLIARLRTIDVVDLKTSTIVHTFQTESMQPRTLKCLRSAPRQTHCGSTGLGSFTLAYVSVDTGDCVLQTYMPHDEDDAICFCDPLEPKTTQCVLLSGTREVKRHIKDPGEWEALPNGSIVGVRRKSSKPATEHGLATTFHSGLRHRNSHDRQQTRSSRERWEVWVMSQLETQESYESRPLEDGEDDCRHQHLMVSELGPIVKVGAGSAAIGFGDMIKVITVGHERFSSSADRLGPEDFVNLANRRRKITNGTSRMRLSPWSMASPPRIA
ncbi:hypothetical protein DL546_005090 [Coniochaeta pulveracea]|uniref:Sterol regulatory element-binding protein cleavage-activating protein n=1 Tax=Coniochaeta pulveracea TaxID=177199 RepID=A0A420Y3M3_9PEZI|nr:hypothetical protein DL546_005090 [Coniochaeta pulveracea]